MTRTRPPNNPKVRTRVALEHHTYAAARHIAADLGPSVEVGTVITIAVEEYVSRHTVGRAASS